MPIDESKVIWDEAGVEWDADVTPPKTVPGIDYQERGWGDVAGEAIKSIPSSTQRFFGGLYEAAAHPLETGEALGRLGVGTIATGHKLFQEATGQDVTEETERIASFIDPVTDYLKGRYTTEEGFKQAIAQDPVGVIADAASVLTGGGAAMQKTPGLTKIGAKVEAAGVAMEPVNIARRATVGMIPEALPDFLYQGAVKFTTGKKLSPAERKQIVRLAVDQGIKPTPKGLEKAWGMVSEYSKRVDSLVDDATAAGDMIDAAGAAAKIDDLKLQIWETFPEPQPYMNALDKLKANFLEAHGNAKTPRQVQELKQGIYQEMQKFYAPGKTQISGPAAAKVKGKKEIASFLREQLEKIHPEIKVLNKDEGTLLKLIDNLEQPVKRIGNRDVLSIGVPIKAGAGYAIGGEAGGAIGTLMGILDDPRIKPQLAIVLDKARKVGRAKDPTTKARMAARLTQLEDEE